MSYPSSAPHDDPDTRDIRRQRILADATRALTSTSDTERTLLQLTAGLVPALAEACTVHLCHGDVLRTVACAGESHLAPADSQVTQAVESATPVNEPHLLILPLRIGPTTLGAISFASTVPFAAGDARLATELVDRIALLLDRARLLRDLQRATRLQDEFLTTLSHGVRTSLNTVLGWTRMLRGGTIPPQRVATVLDTIERNAAALMQVVEELLDRSAPSVGAGPLQGGLSPSPLPPSLPGDAGADAGTLRGRRVLAVDDDESMQELVATMLLMYGVSVRTAGRAAQAMEILSEWRPDVLLTDIAMPGEDGYALMRRVRAQPGPAGTIPAVAMTAFTDPQSVHNAFAAGFDAHLGKPLEPHVLADALSKVLRLR